MNAAAGGGEEEEGCRGGCFCADEGLDINIILYDKRRGKNAAQRHRPLPKKGQFVASNPLRLISQIAVTFDEGDGDDARGEAQRGLSESG